MNFTQPPVIEARSPEMAKHPRGARRPAIEPRKFPILAADTVHLMEGNTLGRDSASARATRRGQRPWREPGDLAAFRLGRSLMWTGYQRPLRLFQSQRRSAKRSYPKRVTWMMPGAPRMAASQPSPGVRRQTAITTSAPTISRPLSSTACRRRRTSSTTAPNAASACGSTLMSRNSIVAALMAETSLLRCRSIPA